MTILASYSEIALKGRYVRNRLERMLAGHIKHQLQRQGYQDPQVTRSFGRIFIDNVPPEAAPTVANVFGVVASMPATRTEPELDTLLKTIVEEALQVMEKEMTFAVRAKVVGDHPYSSQDVAVQAGSAVLEALSEREIKVNLTTPDVTLYIEVRDNNAFVYSRIIPGVLGLPYGSQGKMVSLFSGGIDSPVSTWLMMKRGAHVINLFMDQRPYVGESYVERAKVAFHFLSRYVPLDEYHLFSAPMGEIMKRIGETSEPRFTCIMCKRAMYRIAQYFAEKKEAKALVTGESLGQVASQTLDNMYVLNNASTIPVLRPVVGLDKTEIEKISQRIGIYDLTAKKVDGCTSVPPNPATRSRIQVIVELENELGLVDLCQETAEKIDVLV